jgi:AcrR family transcriptional regulator
MAIAPALLAEFGVRNITFAALALALRITPAAIRHHFIDIDDLLGVILLTHLATLHEALARVPAAAANEAAARRAAYLAATRGDNGRLTAPHTLLVHARNTLPDDLQAQIEPRYAALAEIVAGDRAATTLPLLDSPLFEPETIERMLAALIACEPAPSAAPPAVTPALVLPPLAVPTMAAPALASPQMNIHWSNAAAPKTPEKRPGTATPQIAHCVTNWRLPRAPPPHRASQRLDRPALLKSQRRPAAAPDPPIRISGYG